MIAETSDLSRTPALSSTKHDQVVRRGIARVDGIVQGVSIKFSESDQVAIVEDLGRTQIAALSALARSSP